MPERPARGILRHTMLPRFAARLVAGALASLTLLGAPSVSLAAGTATVPAEPDVTILPGPATLHATAGDLDGDGSRELVRLVGGPETDGRVLVEAWRLTAAGWRAAGEPVPLQRGVSVEEQFADRVSARSGTAPVGVGEPARILAWRDGTRERLIIAALGDQDESVPCCLTLWEPTLVDGALALVLRNRPNGPGETLHALDLDGDGDDELLMTQSQPATTTPGFVEPLEAEVLGWDGTWFRTVDRQQLDQGGRSPIWLIGDTDGRPGDEAGFVQLGRGPSQLYRLRLDAGKLVLDVETVPPLISLTGFGLDDAGAIVYSSGGASFLATWTDGALDVLASSPASGLLLPPVDGPDGPRLPIVEFQPLTLALLDAGLNTLTRAEPSAAAQLATSLGAAGPWIGTLPGGDRRGRNAVIFAGRLIATSGANDQPYPSDGIGEMASLVGSQPVGLLGDGSWLGVLHSLGAPYDLERHGGLLRRDAPPSDPWLAIVPTATSLAPEVEGGRLVPPLDGGVVQVPDADADADAARVVSLPEGFTATIAAPPGSRVVPVALDPPVRGSARGSIVPASGRLTLPIRPPTTDAANLRFAARALVLTPAGHAYTARWDVQVLGTPPALDVAPSTQALSLDVSLDGQTDAGVGLTADGAPVEVADDGAFHISVTAPPWPSTVRLEAVDAVGNRSVQLVSVVGLFDYRTLPWLPIVALMTLASGLLLLLRRPRPLPGATGYDRVDVGALEEIEGDDETTPLR